MVFRISHLTSLKKALLFLTPVSRPEKYNAGSSFNLPLLLRNAGRWSVAWSAAHPLHVSYRWINEAGEAVERDGMRTSIPTPPKPNAEVAVTLSGRTPNEPGNYRLLASLVLEGVHWACDVDEHGWTELNVRVQSAPTWPQQLRNSAGGQALRGAVARAGLARSLDGNISNVPVELAGSSSVDLFTERPDPQPEANPLPVAHGNRLRNWVRRTLGIRNIQQDLERVANAVTRQEQRSAELHNYLERIEIMLGEGSRDIRGEIEQIAAALRKDRIFSKLTAIEVNRTLAAMRTELRAQSYKSQRLLTDHEQSSFVIDKFETPLEEQAREAK